MKESYIQNSELNAIIEKAIKALREKKKRKEFDKNSKHKIKCKMDEILRNATESERRSFNKYFSPAFQRQLNKSLKEHPKVRFNDKEGCFYFEKR
jgi:hypothetical protein